MNKHKFKTFLTVGKLKEIIKDMANDAIVSARDRDCISLDQFHVVNHPKIEPKIEKLIKKPSRWTTMENGKWVHKEDAGGQEYEVNSIRPEYGAKFVMSIDEVYGGRGIELDNKSKQALIFCDCD